MQRRRVPAERNPAKKMAKNIRTFSFVACLVVIAVIFVFSERKKEDKNTVTTTTSEVKKLSEKDLEFGYPETPSEVLKLFGRMNQCIYNTSMSDEEFDQLLKQMRLLYSKQLLEQNPEEEHRENLKAEVADFLSNKKRIVNYTVEKNSAIDYEKVDGCECASVTLAFFMSENSKYLKTFQQYILVKEDGQWKILAFRKQENQSES